MWHGDWWYLTVIEGSVTVWLVVRWQQRLWPVRAAPPGIYQLLGKSTLGQHLHIPRTYRYSIARIMSWRASRCGFYDHVVFKRCLYWRLEKSLCVSECPSSISWLRSLWTSFNYRRYVELPHFEMFHMTLAFEVSVHVSHDFSNIFCQKPWHWCVP